MSTKKSFYHAVLLRGEEKNQSQKGGSLAGLKEVHGTQSTTLAVLP